MDQLETIEKCILDLEGVTKTVVMEVTNPHTHQTETVAHVEARYHITHDDILHHCGHHLEPQMIPTIVKFWDYIPITKWGKPDVDFMRNSCIPIQDSEEPITNHFSSY